MASEQDTSAKKIPTCVSIIMDGNRRWARERGLPTLEGHRRGYEKLREVGRWLKEAGVKYAIFWAFSTENWNRSEEEVSYLMDLFREMLECEVSEMKKEGVKVIIVGQRERFAPDIQKLMDNIERETAHCTEATAVIALSYGGRAEILRAVNELIEQGAKTPLTEEAFEKHLWTAGIPDPDIIVRTSGEKRLSGFLPWQAVYSELFFVKKHWPAFERGDLDAILEEYANRERRHGT